VKSIIAAFSFLLFYSCSQQVTTRAPASTTASSCAEIVEGLIFPDWRQLWDEKQAMGLDPEASLEWVRDTKELAEIVSFAKVEDQVPLERSYAMIHLQHPDWGHQQIAAHYKIWKKSCGL